MNKCKKTSFATEKDALFYIKKLQKTSTRKEIPCRAYLCPNCGSWHITHKVNSFDKEYYIKLIKEKDEKIKNQRVLIKTLEEKLKESTQEKIKRHPRFKE